MQNRMKGNVRGLPVADFPGVSQQPHWRPWGCCWGGLPGATAASSHPMTLHQQLVFIASSPHCRHAWLAKGFGLACLDRPLKNTVPLLKCRSNQRKIYCSCADCYQAGPLVAVVIQPEAVMRKGAGVEGVGGREKGPPALNNLKEGEEGGGGGRDSAPHEQPECAGR